MNQPSRARLALLSLLVAVAVLAPLPAQAQQRGKLEQAAETLIDWFGDLAESIQDLGQGAERQYLVDRLIDLHRDLYLLEHDKDYLIREALHRRPLNQSELERVVGELEARVLASRNDLRAIGSRLSSQTAPRAFEAEQLLRDAMRERNTFLVRLRDAIEAGVEDREIHALAADGEEALMALRNARWELTRLIQRIEDQEGEPEVGEPSNHAAPPDALRRR